MCWTKTTSVMIRITLTRATLWCLDVWVRTFPECQVLWGVLVLSGLSPQKSDLEHKVLKKLILYLIERCQILLEWSCIGTDRSHTSPCPLVKRPTMGMPASELNHRVIKESAVVWWIRLLFIWNTTGYWTLLLSQNVEEWFQDKVCWFDLQICQISIQLSICGMCCLIHGGPTTKRTRLKDHTLTSKSVA